MASCGQITVTFYSALQEGVGRQVELVYTSLGSDLVMAPGLNAGDLLGLIASCSWQHDIPGLTHSHV